MQKKIKGYTIYMSQILGQGSFGSYYLGMSEKTQQYVAIKIIDRSNIDYNEDIKQVLKTEINIIQLIQKIRTIKLYEYLQSSNNYYIIVGFYHKNLSFVVSAIQSNLQRDVKEELLKITKLFYIYMDKFIHCKSNKSVN